MNQSETPKKITIRLITHLVQTQSSIDTLAHEIAVAVDGTVIEQMRRSAQPSSSP